jgi:hypothetical protein
MRAGWSLAGCALCAAVPSCAPSVPATLPDANADVGLGDVAMLVWTTRSPSGLLGYARDEISGKVDANRKVIDGTARFTPTQQRLVVVSAQTLAAGAEAGVAGMTASADVNRATHVAYDVDVTGYLELAPEDAKYLPGCGCCQGGGVSANCSGTYVTRLIRGSGTMQQLHKLEARAGVKASELVRAHGGTTYRRLNETRFVDAFFAYQLEPLATLCSRLSPEQELETLAINAPNNCWVQAHLEDGSRHARAWHVPDAALCQKLAEHHCDGQQHVAACTASFGSEGQVTPLSLFAGAATGGASAPSPAKAPFPSREAQ